MMTEAQPRSSVTRLRTKRPTPPASRRILFVDDQILVARAFARSMRRHGFDVELSADAVDAFERACQEDFDVIVTDLAMPGTSGVQLIEQLVAAGVHTHYVLASGHDEQYVRSQCARCPVAVHVLSKPWDDEVVASLLGGLIDEGHPLAAKAC